MREVLITSFLWLGITSVSQGEGFLPDAGVDVTPSLGEFVITFTKPYVRDAHINPSTKYPHLEKFCPGRNWRIDGQETPRCTEEERTIVSPYMYQEKTRIGRSQPHNHGSTTDINTGAKVCSVGGPSYCNDYFNLRIKDSTFGAIPELGRDKDFQQGPTKEQELAGIIPEEVHTQMLALELKPLWPPYNSEVGYRSANRVRAGANTPEHEPSIGEVESLFANGLGFPGESFFNMNVEVDLDMDLDGKVDYTIKNKPNDPLVVQGYGLSNFPPTLVYVHNTTLWAVPMFDKNNMSGGPPGGHMAWIRMAGHGVIPGKTASDDWPGDLKKGMRDSSVDNVVLDDAALKEIIDKYMPKFTVVVKQAPALPIPPNEIPIPREDECVGENCSIPPPKPSKPTCKLTNSCPPPELIELSSVEAFGRNGKVFVVWETLSEMHNLGFHVLRARKAKEGEAVEYTLEGVPLTEIRQLTQELIPSRGISFWGISYSYTDHTAQPGETYYYAIRDLDEDGKETVHLNTIASIVVPLSGN